MLIRNSALYVVARALAGLLSMAATAMLTRILDPSQYGLYGLSLGVMAFLCAISFDWITMTFLRFGQRQAEREAVVANVVSLYGALVLATGCVAFFIGVSGIAGRLAPALIVGALLAWSMACFELSAAYEAMSFRPANYLRMTVARAILTFGCAVGAGILTHDPVFVAIGMALGLLGGAFLGRLPWELRWPKPDIEVRRQMIVFGLPIVLSSSLDGLLQTGPRFMLQGLVSTAELGHYTAAFLLVQNTIVIVGSSIYTAGYSLSLRRAETGSPEDLQRTLNDNGDLIAAVLLPIVVGLCVTAPSLANVLVSAEYGPTFAQLTPWVAAGAGAWAVRAFFLDQAFQLSGRTGLMAWISGSNAGLALLGSFLLAPKYGAVGVAIAVCLSNGVSCLFSYFVGRRVFKLPMPWRSALRVSACCTVMALAVRLIPGSALVDLVAQVAIGVAVYAACAFALNLLNVRHTAAAFLERGA